MGPPPPTPQNEPELAAAWLSAAADPAIAAQLEAIFARASREIAERGPACWASGRCCNFEAAGHRLYATGLETAYCVLRLAGSTWASAARSAVTHALLSIEGNPPALMQPPGSLRERLGTRLIEARIRGGCPFQLLNLCGVHDIKPIGCRVYFCDRSATDWQHELSESLLADLRALHDRHAIEYRYGEWRDMLERFV